MRQAGVMSQLPTPLRAAVGLAAEVADQARHLPDRAIELPMLAVSTALQLSLRAQQRYAMLAARGEELLNHREPTDEPPPWATFDDPVADAPADGNGAVAGTDPEPRVVEPLASAKRTTTRRATARSRATKAGAAAAGDTPARGTAAGDAPAGGTVAAGDTPARGTAAGDAPAGHAPAGAAAARKTVRRPRNAAPSRFDTVGDE
jgi:hypothetical protein